MSIRVIDVHVHLGVDRVFDEVRTEDEIITAMDKHSIDASIVQNMLGTIDLAEIKKDNERIYRFSKKYRNRIFGLASVNPHIKKQNYKDEIKRCIEEFGFKGIKLHTFAHACSPMSEDGEMVWTMADSLSVPVMVHTGPGIPFALPSQVIPRAKQFPNVDVVLAHSGLVMMAGDAMIAASLAPNIYLETSWTAPHHIEMFLEKFGSEKVLFASDELTNLPVEIAKYQSLFLQGTDKENCMGGTAERVFKLK